MSRYIDAEKVMEEINRIGGHNLCEWETIDVKALIDRQPTADVVEVRHGEWVVDAYKGDEIVRIPYIVHQHNEPYCSLCGTYALLDGAEDYVPSIFCPRCGAKMEREKIIKALECCSTPSGKRCENCPKVTEDALCMYRLAGDALALIKQQDEQIFQLENRLKECENGYAGTLHLERNKLYDAEEKVKKLTEENERLKTATEEAVRSFTRLETLYKIENKRAETIKADTVREMQERFKELMGGENASCGFCNAVGYWSVKTVKGNIDRIAKEMTEPKTEECTDCNHFAGCEPSTLGVCDMYEEDEKE